jgi:uncharacterized protein (DUF58 family)
VKRLLFPSYNRFFRVMEWGRSRFTRAGIMALFLAGLSGVVGVDTHLSLAYQIFAFLAAALLLSFLHGLLFRVRFSAVRELPRLATAGEPFRYRVRISAEGRNLPAGLMLRERLPDPRPDRETFLRTPEPAEAQRNLFDRLTGFYRWEWLTDRRRFGRALPHPLPAVAAGATETVTLTLTPLRRGLLTFQGLTLLRADPLGLFLGAAETKKRQTLVVLPRRYPLPPLRLPGGRRYHAGGVALTSSVGDAEEFVSLREYRPGDPLRRIHWRSWARTGRPVVKEYQEEFFVRHALVLDTFQEAAESDAFEAAVSVAASFACDVRTQESLLDLLFVGSEAFCVTAGRGLGGVERMLEVLAGVRPSGNGRFEELTAHVVRRAVNLSGAICVLLAWDAGRRELVRRLRGLGVPLRVLVVAEEADDLEPELMVDQPNQFHPIRPDRVAEALASL